MSNIRTINLNQGVSEGIQTINLSNNSDTGIPSGGIPKSDLSSDVQTSLDKADSAAQSANLVTEWGGTPSDSNFPSEKLVYDTIGNIETLLAAI